MNHEHNPVAIRIGKLQEIWFEETEKNPDYNLARWVIHTEDVDFLNGFLKLESTPHGKLADLFVVLFTPFVSEDHFAKALIFDWISMYKTEIEQQKMPQVWNFSVFEEKVKELVPEDSGVPLLLEMLEDFSKFSSNHSRPLVVTLIPRTISENGIYARFIKKLIAKNQIHTAVKFAILDFADHHYFVETTTISDKKTIDINPGNLNMREAINQLASQGNQNDPQVQFRICMLKMGEATGNNSRKALDEWGEKLLEAAQKSANQGMWASAHLIYGGFLMHFPAKEETEKMLQKALQLSKRAIAEDKNNVTILIQIYGYLGALESMNGDHKKALHYFDLQAKTSIENDLITSAISSYKTILFLCDQHNYKEEFDSYLQEAYQMGLEIKDEDLKVSDYSFIAYHFIEKNQFTDKEKVAVLNERMERLFGPEWRAELQYRFDEATAQRK